MIITCPNCDTRYLVPESDIGAEGRRVRCASCMHLWFVEPPTVTLDLGQRQMIEPEPEPEDPPSPPEPPEPPRPPDPPRPGHFPDPAPVEAGAARQTDPPRPSAHHDPAPVEPNRPPEPAPEAAARPVGPLSEESPPAAEAEDVAADVAEDGPVPVEDDADEAAAEPVAGPPAPETPDVSEFIRRGGRDGDGGSARRRAANLPAIRVEAARWVPYGWAALGVFVVAVTLSLTLFRAGIADGWPASQRLYAFFAPSAEETPAAAAPATRGPAETAVAATGAHPSTFVSIGYPDPPYEINRRAGAVVLTILPEIRNSGAVPVDLPAIRGVLRNDQGAEVHSWQFQPDPARLEPGDSRKYRTEVSVNNPAQVKEFELLLQWPTSPS